MQSIQGTERAAGDENSHVGVCIFQLREEEKHVNIWTPGVKMTRGKGKGYVKYKLTVKTKGQTEA